MRHQILCIVSGIEFHFEENFGKKIELTEGYSKMLQIWLVFGKGCRRLRKFSIFEIVQYGFCRALNGLSFCIFIFSKDFIVTEND